MGKLLSIETGFTCNSRCKYCTQLDYRAIPQADKLDLTTEQILERIRYAAAEGYDQIGFSGGEPTIRPDFIDLIKEARSHNFKRIGVTSNGRMFAYRQFTEDAMKAGLDGFTFSLHGHTPKIHDGIATAPGALEQALQGLANIAAVKRKHGLQAHLMNNQILLPDNTPYIKEMVELLGPHGVGLFMIQPFITQRSNSDELGRFYVPYDDVVAAVERALPALEEYGARIKPYNVPNCLLWRFGERFVEPQFYGLRSFREYEAMHPGEFRAFKAKQWFRIPDCKTCKEYCPGFRIEQFPQQKMAAALTESAATFDADNDARGSDAPLLFSGTELFDADTIATTFARLAAEHGPVSWMTAMCEKVARPKQAELIADLCESGHLSELVLVGQPLDQRFLAQRVLEKGNLEELRTGLMMLGARTEAGRKLPKLRLLFNVGDFLRLLDDPLVKHHWTRLLTALRRAANGSGPEATGAIRAAIAVAIPNFPRESVPPDMARQRDTNRDLARRIKAACEVAGVGVVFVTLGARRGLDAARARQMAIAEETFAEILPTQSWEKRLFRHPFSMPEMDFVSWSPPWLFERWDLSGEEVSPHVRADDDTGEGPQTGVRVQSVAAALKTIGAASGD